MRPRKPRATECLGPRDAHAEIATPAGDDVTSNGSADHALAKQRCYFRMARHSLIRSPQTETPLNTSDSARLHRSRKPVTGFSPYEGSNPSLSV